MFYSYRTNKICTMETSFTAIDEKVLADLITDIYKKASSGEISLERLAWFAKQDDELFESFDLTTSLHKRFSYLQSKFEFVSYHTGLEVPETYGTYEYFDFMPKTILDKMYINGKQVSENNFGCASSKIMPGEKLDLCIYKLKPGKSITTLGVIMFYMFLENSIMMGLHGLHVIFPENKKILKEGNSYFSLDYMSNLYSREDDNHLIVHALSRENNGYNVYTRPFVSDWCRGENFLIFKRQKV